MAHAHTDRLSVTKGSAQRKGAEATTKACCCEKGTSQYWETPFAECYTCLFYFKPKLNRQQ